MGRARCSRLPARPPDGRHAGGHCAVHVGAISRLRDRRRSERVAVPRRLRTGWAWPGGGPWSCCGRPERGRASCVPWWVSTCAICATYPIWNRKYTFVYSTPVYCGARPSSSVFWNHQTPHLSRGIGDWYGSYRPKITEPPSILYNQLDTTSNGRNRRNRRMHVSWAT